MITRIENKQWKIDPETGFLTIEISLLKSGDMLYHRSELMDSLPEHIKSNEIIMNVPESEISSQASLRSAQGCLAVDGHIWQDINTSSDSIGHVTGIPYFKDGYVYASLVLTNKNAIDKVIAEELVDVSSAYDSDVIWGDETGTQSEIRYNHIALLPKGRGRAGETVRILNQKMELKMDVTKVRLSNGSIVSVLNEDSEKLALADKEQSDKINNMVDPTQFQETLDKLAEVNAQMQTLTETKSDLEGQIAALRDQLDSALSPEQIETAAAEMVENQENAEKIMNSKGLKLDTKLKGQDLKRHVVEQVRLANSKPLTEEELKNDSMINGMFSVYADATVAPTGHTIVNPTQKINNSAAKDKADMKTRLWGKS